MHNNAHSIADTHRILTFRLLQRCTKGVGLAAFLGRHHHLVAHKKVLDLGTGTGIVGLAAAQCGADEVVLTDQPALEPLVRSNIERNSGCAGSRVRFQPLKW